MENLTTNTVLMVRPAAFRANPGTMASNPFQDRTPQAGAELQRLACAEFDGLVATLREAGVRVLVLQDDAQPDTPDALFPNNWFSTHASGRLRLYPMQDHARRLERRLDLLLPALEDAGFRVDEVVTELVERHEAEACFLEGTGSMVLDRPARVAFACRSPRTSGEVLEAFCEAEGYCACCFDALDASGQAYYHTNVILGLGQDFAVFCLEAVPAEQHDALREPLSTGGRRLVQITREQVLRFAGNLIELEGAHGERLVLLSEAALASLDASQRDSICRGGARLVSAAIPTIERFGGGGVRCMLAEIFLPRT